MSVKIREYLHNFEDMDLPNDHGVLLEDGDKVKKLHAVNRSSNNVYLYSIIGKHKMYVKHVQNFIANDCKSDRYITELLYSHLCEKNDVNCMKTYPLKNKKGNICIATEDLRQIKDFKVTQDNYILMDSHGLMDWRSGKDMQECHTNPWLIMTNDKLHQYLLKHIDKEAFDQLIEIMIVDTLLNVYDRFGVTKNLFFVRKKREHKITGLVPIDYEGIETDSFYPYFKNDINDYMKSCYDVSDLMVLAHGTLADIKYSKIMEALKFMYNEGYFNERQKNLIRDILNCNITKELESILNKYNLDIDENILKIYKEIWDRNGEIMQL